jgi:integrase
MSFSKKAGFRFRTRSEITACAAFSATFIWNVPEPAFHLFTRFIGENGRPLTKESFGNLFRKACRDAGLHNRSAHGLRKAAAVRAAKADATVAELEAIFGWQGGTMAALYTRAADRRQLERVPRLLEETTDGLFRRNL